MPCSKCKHWTKLVPDSIGSCRRYPPSIPLEVHSNFYGGTIDDKGNYSGGVTLNAKSPRTEAGFECGEFKQGRL